MSVERCLLGYVSKSIENSMNGAYDNYWQFSGQNDSLKMFSYNQRNIVSNEINF